MLFPPSLPAPVIARAFHAGNGELGLRLEDASAFIDACEADGISELGWELWLVDHLPASDFEKSESAMGHWSGFIPMIGSDVPHIIQDGGTIVQVRAQLLHLNDVSKKIVPEWFPWVRINFSIG